MNLMQQYIHIVNTYRQINIYIVYKVMKMEIWEHISNYLVKKSVRRNLLGNIFSYFVFSSF
jgi:hypothetical protein